MYNLPLTIFANKKEVAQINVAKWRFDTLTEEDAFDLACHEDVVQRDVLPHEIMRKTFEKFDSYKAFLYITHSRPEMKLSPEEFEKWRLIQKEEKKRAKAEKKARRALKLKELEESEKRKIVTSIPHKKKL